MRSWEHLSGVREAGGSKAGRGNATVWPSHGGGGVLKQSRPFLAAPGHGLCNPTHQSLHADCPGEGAQPHTQQLSSSKGNSRRALGSESPLLQLGEGVPLAGEGGDL